MKKKIATENVKKQRQDSKYINETYTKNEIHASMVASDTD